MSEPQVPNEARERPNEILAPAQDVDDGTEKLDTMQSLPDTCSHENLAQNGTDAQPATISSLHESSVQDAEQVEPGRDNPSTAMPEPSKSTSHSSQINSAHPENPVPQYPSTRWDKFQDSWVPEVACCCIAACLLIAACGVLIAADNKPLSWWPWNWQISSALALVTALMEAALLYSITSCLGQLSWVWYTNDRVGSKSALICFEQISHAFTPLGATAFIVQSPARWYVSRTRYSSTTNGKSTGAGPLWALPQWYYY